jgi:hypothetical protein
MGSRTLMRRLQESRATARRVDYSSLLSCRRDTQRSEFAVGFGDKHSSDGVWSVGLLLERKRHFAEPSLHPVRLDVREVLTVYARCALVGATLGKGVGQDVVAVNLVVQGVEAIADFRLRFRV